MDLRKIKALIEAVTEGDIAELEVESKEGKVRIRRNPRDNSGPAPPYVVMSPTALPPGDSTVPPQERSSQLPPKSPPASEKAEPEAAEEPEDSLVMVTAPIVGTFYEASSPGAPPFVEVGDKVEPGQVLCIIEAMKLMNEIEAEVAGVVAKRFVSNAQPVEYGEALFAIEPAD